MIHAPTRDRTDVPVVANMANCPGYLAKKLSKDTEQLAQIAVKEGRVRSNVVSAKTRLQEKCTLSESSISPGR